MMMKKYNFKKAKRIIDALSEDLDRAELSMLEEWYSTMEAVWLKNEGYLLNLS